MKILTVTAEDVVKPYWITFAMDGLVFAFLAAVGLVSRSIDGCSGGIGGPLCDGVSAGAAVVLGCRRH